jgi:hypothetical protein
LDTAFFFFVVVKNRGSCNDIGTYEPNPPYDFVIGVRVLVFLPIPPNRDIAGAGNVDLRPMARYCAGSLRDGCVFRDFFTVFFFCAGALEAQLDQL